MKQKYIFVVIALLLIVNFYLLFQYFSSKKDSSKDITSSPSPSSIKERQPSDNSVDASQEILITSNVPSITATFSNKETILKAIKSLNIFEPNSVALYTEKGLQSQLTTIYGLNVILTNEVQPLGQIFTQDEQGKDKLLQAFGVKYDSSTKIYNLYLYLDRQISEKSNDEDLSRRYSYIMKYAVWDITHPLKPEYDTYEKRLQGKDEFLQKNLSENWINITQ
jgi:hypothetical protein